MKEKYYINEKAHLATEKKTCTLSFFEINKWGGEGVLIRSRGLEKNRKFNKLLPTNKSKSVSSENIPEFKSYKGSVGTQRHLTSL